MSIITAITPQIKDKERCNIFLDNVFYCGLCLETVIKYKLKVGMDIDKNDILTYQYDSEKLKALDKAMSFISRSLKTEKQIQTYLSKKGYGETVIFFVIEKLKGYNYISDIEYAKSYFNTYKNKKGKKLIEYELLNKGIKKEDINEAFPLVEEFDSCKAIKDIASKYMRNKEITKENLSKLYKHLIGKGFSYDEIQSVMDSLKNNIDDD